MDSQPASQYTLIGLSLLSHLEVATLADDSVMQVVTPDCEIGRGKRRFYQPNVTTCEGRGGAACNASPAR